MTGDCILGQFILRLMSRSLTLEQFIIKAMPEGLELKEENRRKGEAKLPKLRSVLVPDPFTFCRPDQELLPSLLARAQNLEELRNVLPPDDVVLLPTNALKIVKKLQIRSYGPSFAPSREDTMRSLDLLRSSSEVNLSSIIAEGQFFSRGKNQMMHDYFHRFISIIFSSSDTLRELKLDSWTMYRSVRANRFPPVQW